MDKENLLEKNTANILNSNRSSNNRRFKDTCNTVSS